jgi:uncharacterized repeat protein (TIGR02543 family)
MPAITVPTRTGYTFGGYYTATNGGGTQYYKADGTSAHICDFTAATTLYAKWTANQYTVTFDTQGGDGGSTSATATYDAAMPAITVPTRTGYTFGGYYTATNGGGTQYYKADGTSAKNWNNTSATTLYAKWTINEYTISFDTNGGIPATIDAIRQDYNTPITAPADPTREGYTFAGWSPALPTTMPADDMTVTAQWTPIDYTITYHLNGGSVTTNPTIYNIETPTFTLKNPTKPGYTFIGWTGTGLTEITKTVVIEQGFMEARTYTANYETAIFTRGALSYEWTGSGTAVKITACNPSATLVTIPETVSNDGVTYTVTTIEADAFSSCTNLLCLIFNSEMPPTLGSGAFSTCTALNAIGVPAGTAAAYKAAAGWLDYEDKIYAIEGTHGTNVYYSYNSTTKTLHIFGTGAMTNNYGPWFNKSYRPDITTVVIGYGVTSIGSMNFLNCIGLTSITIPTSVRSIDASFENCTSLTSIEIPASVTYIGTCAFQGSGLTSIEIPASVTSIGEGTFKDCSNLTSIIIPASMRSIEKDAFTRCNCLTSIEIPASVTYIGTRAFQGSGLTSIEIPAGVTSILEGTFKDCTSLKNVKIPASLTTISAGAFQNCRALKKIEIPASVTSIGNQAFEYCWTLENIEIPASVRRIGDNAFFSNHNTSITIYAPSLDSYGHDAFKDYDVDFGKIYVFKNCMDTYKAQASLLGIKEEDIHPIQSINLKDADDNRSLIAAADEYAPDPLNVTLQGRTLYKDGAWNTLCLPFSLASLTGTPLAGATVMELDTEGTYDTDKKTGLDGTTLYLYFKNATSITAGRPYIVKWSKDDENPTINNPVFTGVTVDNTNRDVTFTGGSFKGTYSPMSWDAEDRSILFLGEDNNLHWPLAGANIGACRAYFELTDGQPAHEFVLNFGEETTSLREISNEELVISNYDYYTLDGRKLDGKPTKKGLYIHGGRKVVIK